MMYQFTLDETGVTAETKGGSRKKNAILNFLFIISHKPVLAGSGLIAASTAERENYLEESRQHPE
jgi:hypothetical protein